MSWLKKKQWKNILGILNVVGWYQIHVFSSDFDNEAN